MDIQSYKLPGQLVEELLIAKGWSKRVLGIILNIDETIINKIISGKRPVNAELSLQLGDLFQVDPEMFLDLQKTYDLEHARITSRPDPKRAIRACLFGDLPVSDMIKRRWLNATDVKDVSSVEAALIKFFSVNSIDEIEVLPHAAKKTHTFMPATSAQIAWIYRVRQIAVDMMVARYSPTAALQCPAHLTKLLCAREEIRKVPRILAECGIRYVIVESLPSTKIDGVCFWLDDVSPVIAMSLRHDRIDNFWFVLRHELEHVIQLHGKAAVMLDTELEGKRAGMGSDIAEEERHANEAAADFCVPRKAMNSFIARKSPFFKSDDILGLANTLKIHPGIIAGQLQHRIDRYDLFRQYLVKVRSIIVQNAMVDGWGNVAPVDL